MPSFYTPPPIQRYIDGDFSIATLPPAADNTKKYAWVTDLHDGQPDYVISDGTFWKPVRPLAARVVADSNAAMTLTALVNSPTQIMRGTLTASRNVSLSPTNAYPGAKFRIKREAAGTLLNLNIIGVVTTILGLTTPWVDMEYVAGTGWVQTASGSLI